jgi:hypothetical protein
MQPQLLQENFVYNNNWANKPSGSNMAGMIEEVIRLLID